jgi:limonene-1,2-epoxide hydrolase
MNDTQSAVAGCESMVLTVLTHLKNGEIRKAVDGFADAFTYKDRGIGLEFKDKERLGEFFQKARELYPESVLLTETIFVSGDHVITEWTLRTSISEACFGARSRKVQVTIHGVSVVGAENGKITRWSDYYDGLSARRSALGAYFEDWDGL